MEKNVRKWICRISLSGTQKLLILPDINKNEMEISLENDDNSVALLANIPVNRIKNQAKR